MKRVLKLFIMLLPLSCMIYSCYPEFDATVEDLDIAITKYDSETNFDALNTFYLYDTVMYIEDDDLFSNITSHVHDATILSQVRQNLSDKGWTEVIGNSPEEVNADVSILISALKTDVNNYYVGWYDYWYWYPWNYWYPWYYSYPVYPINTVYSIYEYTLGTVIIDMFDMKSAELNEDVDPPTASIPIIWTGAINGILSGTTENIESRLTTEINQVFKQSTYLDK